MTTAIEVKERPILMSGAMVRAILAGQKTQTRPVMKPQPEDEWMQWLIQNNGGSRSYFNSLDHPDEPGEPAMHIYTDQEFPERDNGECKYGKPGDRLWVRETFLCHSRDWPLQTEAARHNLYYRADGTPDFVSGDIDCWWRPSIHMPRWASRLTLEIVSVRVERVQDITTKDAIAEGIIPYRCQRGAFQGMRFWENYLDPDSKFFDQPDAPIKSFQSLWDSINAGRGYSWESNPWVWCIAFKRIDPA